MKQILHRTLNKRRDEIRQRYGGNSVPLLIFPRSSRCVLRSQLGVRVGIYMRDINTPL
jgi:hypothetical protein